MCSSSEWGEKKARNKIRFPSTNSSSFVLLNACTEVCVDDCLLKCHTHKTPTALEEHFLCILVHKRSAIIRYLWTDVLSSVCVIIPS